MLIYKEQIIFNASFDSPQIKHLYLNRIFQSQAPIDFYKKHGENVSFMLHVLSFYQNFCVRPEVEEQNTVRAKKAKKTYYMCF